MDYAKARTSVVLLLLVSFVFVPFDDAFANNEAPGFATDLSGTLPPGVTLLEEIPGPFTAYAIATGDTFTIPEGATLHVKGTNLLFFIETGATMNNFGTLILENTGSDLFQVTVFGTFNACEENATVLIGTTSFASSGTGEITSDNCD